MMTAEPSAADVKRALPYSPPHYAGGSATAAKARASAAAAASGKPENRAHGRGREDDRDSDGGVDEDGDEPDDDDDDDDSGGTKVAKKPQVKAEADNSAATAGGKTGEDEDDNDEKKANATKKSRRELPPHTVAILKGWMLSPEHVKHPYPTDEDKQMLLKKTGINMKQLTNWFTNARKRIWKPMMRREHSRQLQSAIEYEKTQPRDGFAAVGGAPHPHAYRDGEFPGAARGVVRHSFDAGSLGGPHPQVQVDPYGRVGPMYPPPPPPHASSAVGYAPRAGRSHSEALPGTDMDGYIDAMRIRKRVHAPDDAAAEAFGPSDKRFRRGAAMSPRSLKILQDWVATHSHLEYPFPTDPEKLQLSRDTGLDVQQIELWFKNNRERIGAANYAIQNGAPGLSPSRRSLPGRSIPSRDNPMFPSSGYGERREAAGHRSIPANGNPMFPPRPAAPQMQRSSIPGNGNPQFPPPPSARRDAPDGYYPNPNSLPPPSYGSGQYAAHGSYSSADAARQARSMSINVGQFMRPQPVASSSANVPAPPGAPGAVSGLPSLSARNALPRASGGPTMGQPRDGRSHTLDMGLFTDARRRKMNFQDILASTSAAASAVPHRVPTPTAAARPLSAAGIAEPNSLASAAEAHGYAHAVPAYGAKSFERPHLGTTESGSCARCGARAGACSCGVAEDAQLRRIV